MRTYTTRSGSIPIAFDPLPSIDDPNSLYEGFHPGTTVLPQGVTVRPGYAPLPCDILWERDVPLTLADGTTVYLDVHRPVTDDPVPVIVGWGPAGKGGMRDMLMIFPGRMDVPTSRLSGLQGWECADPADWVPHGYATVQVDPRGCNMSEGDLQYFGAIDADDVRQVVEWLADLSWTNGRIGMSGNSWYAMTQWWGASTRPRGLAAIAPWEGQDDLYLEEYVRGGIPMPRYPAERCWSNGGRVEAICTMAQRYPLYNEYWAEKRPPIEDIDVPVYAVASYSSWTHSQGTFHAWERLRTEQRWLRVHAAAEWPDYYDQENLADLRRFFDRYLKDEVNGWENTPRVRMRTLDLGHPPTGYIVASDFPPKPLPEQTWYLRADDGSLSAAPQTEAGSVTYTSDDGCSRAVFRLPVTKDLEITGYVGVRLWVEAPDADDLDVYVSLGKVDVAGVVLAHDAVGEWFYGSFGQLRASHRSVDPERSTRTRPVHPHTEERLLDPNEVVAVDIALSPTSMLFHPGEQIELRVSGHRMEHARKAEVEDEAERRAVAIMLGRDPDAPPAPVPSTSRNRGRHVVHCGGRFDSTLTVPLATRADAGDATTAVG